MGKHPILAAFGAAAVICGAITFIWMGFARNVDEKPFIAAFMLVVFPFAWFALWLVFNAVGWWKDQTRPPPES